MGGNLAKDYYTHPCSNLIVMVLILVIASNIIDFCHFFLLIDPEYLHTCAASDCSTCLYVTILLKNNCLTLVCKISYAIRIIQSQVDFKLKYPFNYNHCM